MRRQAILDEPQDIEPLAGEPTETEAADAGETMFDSADFDFPEGQGGQLTVFSGPVVRHDWSNALLLVERAARLIRDYEQKFISIEREARDFMKRVEEDQTRSRRQIAGLEEKLAHAEERLKTANAENWDKKVRIQQLQRALWEAQEEIGKSGDYIRRVEGLLGGI